MVDKYGLELAVGDYMYSTTSYKYRLYRIMIITPFGVFADSLTDCVKNSFFYPEHIVHLTKEEALLELFSR
jgi:hypothetical protein